RPTSPLKYDAVRVRITNSGVAVPHVQQLEPFAQVALEDGRIFQVEAVTHFQGVEAKAELCGFRRARLGIYLTFVEVADTGPARLIDLQHRLRRAGAHHRKNLERRRLVRGRHLQALGVRVRVEVPPTERRDLDAGHARKLGAQVRNRNWLRV